MALTRPYIVFGGEGVYRPVKMSKSYFAKTAYDVKAQKRLIRKRYPGLVSKVNADIIRARKKVPVSISFFGGYGQ